MMEARESRTVLWLGAIAFLVAAIALFVRLGDLPLLSPDEGRNAEVAREMQVSGSALVPTYNGLPYLDKPFLYFKSVALAFSVCGVNEWAARLPSTLAALAILGTLFAFCRRAEGAEGRAPAPGALVAVLSVLIVASSPLFVVFARTVIFDMPLAFFVLLSILAAYRAEQAGGRGRRLGWMLSAAAAGVATLIKGPVGFIVPGLVIVVQGMIGGRPAGAGGGLRGRLRILGALLAPLNLAVFFAVTLPWFLALVHRQPDFVQYGLVEETFRRYTTTAFRRTAPFYYYGPVVLGVFFPWSLLLPESIAAAWRSRRRWAPADRWFIVGALSIVAFFSTSQSKLPGYILPGVILLGPLTARVFAHALRDGAGRGAAIVRRGGLLLAIAALSGALFLALVRTQPEWVMATFRTPRGEFQRLQPVVLPLMFTFLALGVLSLVAWRARRPLLTLAVFASFSLCLVTVDFGALRSYAEANSSRAIADTIRQTMARESSATRTPDGSRVEPLIAGLEWFSNGLPFYLRRPIHLITRDGHELTSNYLVYALRHADAWPEGVVRYEQRDAWLAARTTPVYLIAGWNGRTELQRLAAERGAVIREIRAGTWAALLAPAVSR